MLSAPQKLWGLGLNTWTQNRRSQLLPVLGVKKKPFSLSQTFKRDLPVINEFPTESLQIQQLECCSLSVIILYKTHFPACKELMLNVTLYYLKLPSCAIVTASFPCSSLKLQLVFSHHTIQCIKFNQLPAVVVTSPSFCSHLREWGWLLLLKVSASLESHSLEVFSTVSYNKHWLVPLEHMEQITLRISFVHIPNCLETCRKGKKRIIHCWSSILARKPELNQKHLQQTSDKF